MKYGTIQSYSQIGSSIAAVIGIMIAQLCFPSGVAIGQSLYLIHNGPLELGSPNVPNKAIIFRLNETAGTLETVCGPIPDTGMSSRIWNIDVYSEGGPVVIAEGEWFATKLHIISENNISYAEIIDLSPYGTIMKYWYFRSGDRAGEIQIRYSSDPLTKTTVPLMKRLSISARNSQDNVKDAVGEEELRLTGPESAYGGGGKSDVVGIRISSTGVLEPKGIDIDLDGNPVPSDVVKMKSSYGWTLIANEPTYRALLSIPEKNDLTQRELLIYHRKAGIWNSLLLEGAETAPRVINGWLAGIIADSHPNTNYETRKGEPAILREDAIIIDPQNGSCFVTHLGKEGEILWIENDSVYYRVGQELYRARIEGNKLVDRTLILKDFRMHFIHWAFRGSEGGK